MSPDEYSLRKRMPNFVISAGTQVVLKVAKRLPGGQGHKPPGSVGVVVESPASNREPYVVRFADGRLVKAYFQEMAVRRREVEDAIGTVGEDLRAHVIYRCQVGSKAFGLARDESDDDIRGIYASGPPHWSLRRLPEQLEFSDEERAEVYWELENRLDESCRVCETHQLVVPPYRSRVVRFTHPTGSRSTRTGRRSTSS